MSDRCKTPFFFIPFPGFFLAWAALLFSCFSCFAATVTWDGSTSTDWSLAANWDTDTVPQAGDEVVIPAGAVRMPVIDGADAAAHNLTIDSGATLAINQDQLTLDGSLYQSGSLTLQNDAHMVVGDELTLLAGTLDAASGNIDAHHVKISNGTFLAPGNGQDFTVSGDWEHPGGVFTHNNGTVVFDATSAVAESSQLISGNTVFYGFTKEVPAGASQTHTLVLTYLSTQTIEHYLTLTGADETVLRRLYVINSSSSLGQRANLILQQGGGQLIRNVSIRGNNASGGCTLVARGTSANALANLNWDFGTTTLIWTGAVSTAWDDQFNWDMGVAPDTGDEVTIPALGGVDPHYPVLTDQAGDVSLEWLFLSGAEPTLTLAGHNLTLSEIYNEGTIILRGDETVTIAGLNNSTGTFEYVGDGDGTPETHTIRIAGPNMFYHLAVNDTHGVPDSFVVDADMQIYGNLSAASGALSLDAPGVDVTVDGSVYIAGGTLTAPGTGKTFTVSGNFVYSAGTFDPNHGTLMLGGVDQGLYGDTRFDGLVKEGSDGRLVFDHTATQRVSELLRLKGTSGHPLVLRSDSPDSDPASTRAWGLVLEADGLQEIDYVDVKDSDARTGLTLVGRNATDAGFNQNWFLAEATMTWTGGAGTSAWDDPENWDLGIAPQTGDHAVIVPAATQPDLASVTGTVVLGDLTISEGATLTLSGKALTVQGTLSNEGTVILQGGESVSIADPDINSGTFEYRGDGDGTSNPYSFTSTGPSVFYDLSINDTHATPDSFLIDTDLFVYGTLTNTGAVLDLDAAGADVDIDGSLYILSGTVTAPGAGRSLTVGGSWTRAPAAVFTPNGGRVTLDSAVPSVVTGDTAFYDLSIVSPAGKTVSFAGNSTQTVAHDLALAGGAGHRLVLQSVTSATKWNLVVPTGMTATEVSVMDSAALVNNDPLDFILAISSIDRKDSNGANTNTGWRFGDFYLIAPREGAAVGTTPVVVGQAPANEVINLLDEDGHVVAITQADANGNFRVRVGEKSSAGLPGTIEAASLSTGANSLTPRYGVTDGTRVDITVSASPSTSQVPVIAAPADGAFLGSPLPTITGQARPGVQVDVVASDSLGNLLLTLPPTAAGSGTADSVGTFAVTLSTPLPPGTVYLSVVVDGVSSDILTYYSNDIHGVVFDAASNNPVAEARVYLYKGDGTTLAEAGVDLAVGQENPRITSADGTYGFLSFNASGSYMIRVEAFGFGFPTQLENAALPPDRSVTTGSRGEVIALGSLVQAIDLPVDGAQALLKVEKDANKSAAKVGDVVTYTVTIENLSSVNAVSSASLYDMIPPGFKFLKGRVQLGGVPVSDPTGNRPLCFTTGTLAPREKKTLRYQLVVGSGVMPGNYENSAYMRQDNGTVISNYATETVKITLDPLFDAGSVFGKVYYDLNENGRQDAPDYVYEDREEIIEGPVARVRIVMEDGTIVTTDRNGQFHIPNLVPGRHVLRVDEKTLPPGAYVTTSKAEIIDVTAGSVVELNFGINVDNVKIVGEDARFFREKVRVDQITDQPVPKLNVDTFSPEILLYNGAVMEQVEFRIFTNYAPFIQSWHLDIIDQSTKRVVRKFSGTRYGMFDPILWDGRGSDGRYVRSDRKYAYILKVEDGKGGWGETREKPIAVKVLSEEEEKIRQQHRTDEETKADRLEGARKYRSWLFAQRSVNLLNHQTMAVAGETWVIDPQGTDIRSVRILKKGDNFADVPVLAPPVLTAQDVLAGEKETVSAIEVIVPEGDYELEVVSAEGVRPGHFADRPGAVLGASPSGSPGSEGSLTKVTQYRTPMKAGEDSLMFVALGDGKIGYNVKQGAVEPLNGSEGYQKGFYQQGKMAYYLKGKVKGKYLVTSSFDSERKQKEMFRSVEDEEYYPIYGDASTINYDATNTQGNLYLLVEWDRSQAIWGNYAVDLNNTDFARYSRTLYGGKVDYADVASTPYGDPRTHVVVFHADVRQRSAHNEFLGTGGSLYYLKNQGLVSGSLKVRTEVRDAVTGLVLSTTQMKEGADFDVDYAEGRILFWQPVSMSADSGRLISNNLLQGDPVYVVADYEYELKDKITEGTQGARIEQAVADNVVVGTTYVKETQADANYELQGQDVTLHVGEGTTIKAEYAQTTSEDAGTFVSMDGGITFSELATADNASGRAYGISQDSRLFDRMGMKSYYKWVDHNFSTSATASQQGKEMTGMSMTFDLTPVTRLSASYDVQKLIEQGNLQTRMQVGAEETRTTVLRLVHEARRLRITGELRSQQVSGKNDVYQSEANSAQNAVALEAEYDVDPKTRITVKQQVDAAQNGEAGAQTTASVTRQLTDKISGTLGETVGSQGSATQVGLAANVTPKITVGTEYSMANSKSSQIGNALTTSVTAKDQIGQATQVQAKYSVTQGSSQGAKEAVVLGADSGVTIGDTALKAAVAVGGENETFVRQDVTLGAEKSEKDGRKTTSSVKVGESVEQGKTTTVTLGTSGDLASETQLVSERSSTFGKDVRENVDTYKIVKMKDGRKLESSYARKYSQTQPERSASNIFGLTGDINDKWAASASLEQGQVQSVDGSIYDRLAVSGALGYLQKNEEGQEVLKSSTKLEARLDEGTPDRTQFLIYQAAEGRVSDQTTLSGKIEWSRTRNKTTGEDDAQYKEIMLGGAYRPIAFDRLNLFGKYTYKENQKPQGQINTSDIEHTKMHVLSAAGAYDLTEEWQIVERLAYRIMEEKVAGFDFAKTHTWLLINRANYRINQDWKLGGEYRILTQKEAKDQKKGFLMELVRSVNDNVELGVGYNFTDFADDLTDLDYTLQGPYIRMTGKLYDRTPEERKRARDRWIERKVEKYAWKMVSKEFGRKDSPLVIELNQMYHMAQVASELGKYEEARQIYKDVILATRMMYEEAAQFVRKHIAFEENLYNAYERAQEYYDQGELWMARKVWEKIVEEAERSMLE